MNDIKSAAIKIRSTINGDEIYNEYTGEYMYQNGIHTIAYSPYSGTELTKTAYRHQKM